MVDGAGPGSRLAAQPKVPPGGQTVTLPVAAGPRVVAALSTPQKWKHVLSGKQSAWKTLNHKVQLPLIHLQQKVTLKKALLTQRGNPLLGHQHVT